MSRVVVAAFGDAGHAFPAIALARALRAGGHEVLVESWDRWREAVEAEGLAFTAAEEYKTFPPPPPGSAEGASVVEAARALVPMLEEWGAEMVVSDVLTLAPALAAEVAGVRWATLVPHLYPVSERAMPFFSVGAQPPRTALGGRLWEAASPVLEAGLRRGRRELNEVRARLGLPEVERFHGGLSRELVLVATLPQLEYAREWPREVRVTGPMEFELPYPDVALAEGEAPLVVVAPSTAQDPAGRLVRVALDGLAEEPVRVLATTNRPGEALPPAPANAVVVDWVRYSQVLPLADVVVCHGGHGTVCRALGAGVPLVCCPAVGDMAENAARVAWAGAGLMLPWRLTTQRSLRAVVRRVLEEPRLGARAAEIATWSRAHDGAAEGARLVEELPASAG